MHRRDFITSFALAASAVALPALAATRAPKPIRLLILGGTGFIGPHQVRYALARGHQVTVFNRGRQKEAWPGPVEELLGDRNGDLKALEGRDWDVCIDNPTSLPVWDGDDPMAETSRSLSANQRLYGPLKALSEKEVQAQYGQVLTTIIRPSLIVGPGDETDRFTYWPVRLAGGGEILAPGDGTMARPAGTN
jgi:2'-hydroxyisoflavone reductase